MLRRRTWLVVLACFAARAGLAQVEPLRDDPRARAAALNLLRGEQSPAGQWRVLQEARLQRDRYSAVTNRLVFSSRVEGNAFVSLGPENADFEFNGARYDEVDSGRARQILPHPTDPGILYLSTAGGGVWKSWDAGAHWEPITDMLGTLAVGALAMDPADPDVLYLGFGDPFDQHQPGLVKSTDGGATWSEPVLLTSGSLVANAVLDIKVDPTNSSLVLAATDIGLFRSTDAGATWQAAALKDPAGDTFFYLWSLAWVGPSNWLATGEVADPTKPASAAQNAAALGLWASFDDGATWAWSASALPGGDALAATAGRGTLAVAPSTLVDPATARVYLLAATLKGEQQLDLYRSDDGGRTFTALGLNAAHTPLNPNGDQADLDLGHQQAWYNQALLVDPQEPDLVFAAGDMSVLRSTNGGNSWQVISNWLPGPQGLSLPYVHADIHALAVGPDGTLYAGSDGGIFVSANARADAPEKIVFSSALNRGLVTHLVYTVACAPETWPADLQGWVGGGLQDNGTRVRSNGSTSFNQVIGGDGISLVTGGSAHVDAALGSIPDVLLGTAEYKIYRSTDGGENWQGFLNGFGKASAPFFVRIARDAASADPQTFVTFSGTPPAAFRSTGGGPWTDISGTLHWQDSNANTTGFVTADGSSIALRGVSTHPVKSGVYGLHSNKFAYVTGDGGAHWLVSVQPAPADGPPGAGIYLLSSIALDSRDPSGNSYWLTSRAMNLVDAKGNVLPLPESFGHVYRTTDGGAHFTSVGAQAVNSGGLPFVPAVVIEQDPGEPATLYVGTALGLYRSVDDGATWARMGAGSLPLVEVTDICISPASQRLTVATYGRGFWQIDTGASTPAGVRGSGDTNFDQRIDGRDLMDLLDAYNATQASTAYRWQADLTGDVNAVDAADLSALLAKFGGQP